MEKLGITWVQALIHLAGYLVAIGLSGFVVQFFVGTGPSNSDAHTTDEQPSSRFDIGAIIGKCENILIVTFILVGAYTGLALIFTAKSIVRREDKSRNPRYYFGGTLVNLVFSVLIGFAMRIALRAA